MKKLRLKALELGAKEVLTRDQLKMVLGGVDGGSGSGSGKGSGSGTKKCSGSCGGKWISDPKSGGHWEYGTCGMSAGLPGMPGTGGCFCSIGSGGCN